jgi:hypothetical protein
MPASTTVTSQKPPGRAALPTGAPCWAAAGTAFLAWAANTAAPPLGLRTAPAGRPGGASTGRRP